MSESRVFFPDRELDEMAVEPGRVNRKIRAHGGGLMLAEVIFQTGAIGYEHRHVHEQVCYCLSGEFEFSVEGEKSRLIPGDSVYIPPSALHGALCISEGRLLDIFTPQRDDFL